MKINTISAYALVYLLARGHWNLIVPVRADGEGDGSSGSSGSPASHTDGSTASTTADAGSALAASTETTGTASRPASRASSKAGSSAGSTAGSRASSTAGSKAGSVADLTSLTPEETSSTLTAPPANEGTGADASLTVSTGPDGTVASSDGSTDPTLASAEAAETSTDADSGSSGESAKTETELGSLFLGQGGDSVEYTPGLALRTKKEEAMGLADEARKTAEKLQRAAEKMIKEAEELTKAAQDAKDIESLTAKMDAAAYNVGVARTEASEDSKPLDMTYYDSFPSGHHHRADYQCLLRMYKEHRWNSTETYHYGFPNGWHAANLGDFDLIEQEAKKYREKKYEEDREAKRKQITDKEVEINKNAQKIATKETEMAKKKEALEDKHEELEAKKQEVNEMREVIAELHRQLTILESESRELAGEHGRLLASFKLLEMDHRKLADEKAKLLHERTVLEEEQWNIIKDYVSLNEKLQYVYGYQVSSIHENHFPSASFTHPGLDFDEPAKSEPAESGSAAPASEDAGKTAGEPAEPSSTVPAPEDSGAKPAETTPAVPVSTPAPTHVAARSAPAEPVKEAAPVSTPAHTASATHVAPTHVTATSEPAKAEPVKEPAKEAAKAPAKGAAPAVLRLFKAEADGTEVEMVESTDFTKKPFVGDDKYEFKDNVKCTKVMFGDHELWKKGDENVNEPVNVTYRNTLNVVVVRDNQYSVSYKKDSLKDEWKHDGTTERTVPTRTAQPGSQASSTAKSVIGTGTPSARTGLISPGLARGHTGGSTTNLQSASSMGGSTTNLTASSMMGLSTSTESLSGIEEKSEPKSGTGTLRGAGASH